MFRMCAVVQQLMGSPSRYMSNHRQSTGLYSGPNSRCSLLSRKCKTCEASTSVFKILTPWDCCGGTYVIVQVGDAVAPPHFCPEESSDGGFPSLHTQAGPDNVIP